MNSAYLMISDRSVSCSQSLLEYLTFKTSGYGRIRWRLFQKRVVCTKLDIYVFILKTKTTKQDLFFVLKLVHGNKIFHIYKMIWNCKTINNGAAFHFKHLWLSSANTRIIFLCYMTCMPSLVMYVYPGYFLWKY